MLTINFIRALVILAAFAFYGLLTDDPITAWEGFALLVSVAPALVLESVFTEAVISWFNRSKNP